MGLVAAVCVVKLLPVRGKLTRSFLLLFALAFATHMLPSVSTAIDCGWSKAVDPGRNGLPLTGCPLGASSISDSWLLLAVLTTQIFPPASAASALGSTGAPALAPSE